MLKIGIVGLPNVGKSTLFKALTKKQVEIANYPFTTINPNIGIVAVPDERLEKIIKLLKPKNHFPSVIEFVDIAGLVKNAHQGEGLGNQFLSHIYEVDAILFIVRCFKDKNITSVIEEINPQKELEILKEELKRKDEEIIKRDKKDQTQASLLIQKLTFVICNINTGRENVNYKNCRLTLDAKLELEALELSKEDIKEINFTSKLPELIKLAYETLGLITFYTIKGGQEIRAWPIKAGALTPQAGGIVHSDFEEKFIRAEVIAWDKLLEVPRPLHDRDSGHPSLGTGIWSKAREKGILRTIGKDYVIQDGDVVEFKI